MICSSVSTEHGPAQNFELLKDLGKLRKPVLIKRGMANTLQELLMSRGLSAPPRRTSAPAALTAWATEMICSSVSTEHGPAITRKCPPPILAPLETFSISDFILRQE